MAKCFVGIDIQMRRNCCYAVLDETGTLTKSGWFPSAEADAVDLVKQLSGKGQVIVGIDAPRMPLVSRRRWYWNKNKRRWDKRGSQRGYGRHCEVVISAHRIANPQWTPPEAEAPEWMQLGFSFFKALEGLAIDVFTQMKEFGDLAGDPYLEFCEDWMLADEVTHVKMGSDWLRKVTEKDPDRRKKALEFQQVVDKLFSFGGARGDHEESSFKLARRFRELAGFTDDENDTINKLGNDAFNERSAAIKQAQDAAAVFADA